MRRTRNGLVSVGVLAVCIASGVWIVQLFSSSATLQNPEHKPGSKRDEFSWGKLVPSKELQWKDCIPGRQCARFIVPLNHSEPEGLEAIIALMRIPSAFPVDSEFYRGPILFNPGGPGGSGVDTIEGIQGPLLRSIIGPQFDIIGFDPRGIRRSLPRASFFKTDVERAIWGEGFNVINNSDEGIARTWARARVVSELAAETDYGYLKHLNTEQTARDMMRIVEAHGMSKIQYWGVSYGSVLGATFAAMFPDRVKRMVIDGIVDSENYYAGEYRESLLDTDKSLESFFTGCVEAGEEGCHFWAPTAEDIRRNLSDLYNSIRSRPLPIKTKSSYGLLDYSVLRTEVFFNLYEPYRNFPSLAQGLAELAAGDGRLIFGKSYWPPYKCPSDSDDEAFDFVYDAQTAIICNDIDDVPEDLQSSQEFFESMMKKSSWGDIWAGIRLGCVGWPKFSKDRFRGPFNAHTSHPILLIGNTADPVTPLAAAKKMSRGFKDSVVLTQDSTGHTSLSGPSLCTMKYIRKYLVDGSLPAPGTICKPNGKPFPASGLGHKADDWTQSIMGLDEEDEGILRAITELSKMPVVQFPFLRRNTKVF